MPRLDFSKTYKPQMISQGQRIEVRISNAMLHSSEESGNESIHIVLFPTSIEKTSAIHEYVGIPSEEEYAAYLEPDTDNAELADIGNRKLKRIEEVLKCFGIPIDDEMREAGEKRQLPDWIGRKGIVEIDVESPRGGFEARNRVKTWVS